MQCWYVNNTPCSYNSADTCMDWQPPPTKDACQLIVHTTDVHLLVTNKTTIYTPWIMLEHHAYKIHCAWTARQLLAYTGACIPIQLICRCILVQDSMYVFNQRWIFSKNMIVTIGDTCFLLELLFGHRTITMLHMSCTNQISNNVSANMINVESTLLVAPFLRSRFRYQYSLIRTCIKKRQFRFLLHYL